MEGTVKTGGEARRISFVSLVFFMCIAGVGLTAGGIAFVFYHPDQWSVSSSMITLGVGLFPVAYIFKGASPKDTEKKGTGDPETPKVSGTTIKRTAKTATNKKKKMTVIPDSPQIADDFVIPIPGSVSENEDGDDKSE
jgi:hypothetical protein